MVLLGVVVFGGVAGVAWRGFVPRRPPLNVVLLLVDTLRADHLGVYGYDRPTSPNFDRIFGAEGVLFRTARAQASCTFPSVNSILTSRYPAAFFDQPEKRIGIPEGTPTLAEILKQNGYATIALSASPIVRKTGTKYNNFGGFDRGFDVFDEQCMWREARCMNEKLVSYLDQAREPFFAYVHYIDPHDPYRPPGWYQKRYALDYEGPDFVVAGNPNPIADAIQWSKPMPEYQPRDLQHLVNLYDDEISYFDGELAVLMGELASRGVLDHTIVVLAADHGEQFLEHGYMKHCWTLFETDIHTPLALLLPGATKGVDVREPVQNVDVVPTVLDYAGIDARGFTFDGESLRPLIEGARPPAEYTFAMQGTRRSVADQRFKLRYNAKLREFNLHDLDADPEERLNVLGDHTADFLRLQQALGEWETRIAEGKTATEMVAASEAVQERLRALGYIH